MLGECNDDGGDDGGDNGDDEGDDNDDDKKKNGTAGQLGAVMVCISKTESPFSTLRHEHIGTGTGNSGDVGCGT